jgi:hypothetical protein
MEPTKNTAAKRNKIIYWIATLWLALGMVATGIVQLLRQTSEVKNMQHLGYPLYLLTLIGIWKILGVITLFIPKFPVLKEWAYAGFFFSMSGAIFSHIAVGNTMKEIAPPLLLLVLTIISWYFRPANKKLVLVAQ